MSKYLDCPKCGRSVEVNYWHTYQNAYAYLRCPCGYHSQDGHGANDREANKELQRLLHDERP